MEIPSIKLPRKPTTISFSPGIPFFQLLKILDHRFETVFLLESLGDNTYDSRYSLIGFDPEYLLRAERNSLFINDQEYKVKNPYYALREFLPDNIISSNYAGGLVGYLGYDSMTYFEPELSIKGHPDFPPFLFGFYEDGLIHDKFTGETFYFYYRKNRLSLLKELIKEGVTAEETVSAQEVGPSRNKEEHHSMVTETIEEIRAGNTFQCQIGFQVRYKIQGNPLLIYEKMGRINPSPHMFYLKFPGDLRLIGASPELLFRLRNGEMESFPLAGTTKRSADPKEDLELVRKLLSDPKEIAEHNMLIDLHRNDIGRVARFGTVKVRRRFDIKKFSHVQHISSEVVGVIRHEEDMFSGLASSFPAGTLSGAPKIESMKIIERVEKEPRGPYGGAVGHFGMNGDCTFAIPIRTLFIKGENAFARASGGIVFDSDPSAEYEEIQNKLASVLRTLKELNQ